MKPSSRNEVRWLLFPVIAWYDIMEPCVVDVRVLLLFPVIAWYDIMDPDVRVTAGELLFPVIAWYDIMSIARNSTV